MTCITRPVVAFLCLVAFLLVTTSASAQKPTDQIFKKDGSTVAAKVLEITATEIKYKKASNPDGPTYTLLKSDAVKIIYSNGEVENYANTVAAKPAPLKDETPFGLDNFLTFSPDGRQVITDLTFSDNKNYLCYWTYDSKLQRKIPFGNGRERQGLYNWQLVAADGSYVNSATLYDNSDNVLVTFNNPQTGQHFGKEATGNIISPDGRRILIKAGHEKGSKFIHVFDNKGTLLKSIKEEGWNGVGAWRFSDHSAYFLFLINKGLTKKGLIMVHDSDGNVVSQIQLENGYEDYKYYSINSYGNYATKGSVVFSSDGTLIVAPDNDETVGIWDIKGTLVRHLSHVKAKLVAISRDGKLVATVGGLPFGKEESFSGKACSGGQIKIWAIDGTLVKEISFPTNPGSVEFTPDNSGLVVTVEGTPIWLWANQDYKLPDGYNTVLVEVAKSQEEARASQRAAEKRERHAAKMSGLAQGFVEGMAQAGKEMNAINKKHAAQEQFINNSVNKALADCQYVVYTEIHGDYIAISDIFKLNRACDLHPGKATVKVGNTYEEVDKWIKALKAKEDKDNGRGVEDFTLWNDHYKNAAYVGEGGCRCK